QLLPFGKRDEGRLCGASIKADKGTNEQSETAAFALRALDILRAADAAFRENTLKFLQVTFGQRLIHSQLVNRNVVFVLSQERSRFRTELHEVIDSREC